MTGNSHLPSDQVNKLSKEEE